MGFNQLFKFNKNRAEIIYAILFQFTVAIKFIVNLRQIYCYLVLLAAFHFAHPKRDYIRLLREYHIQIKSSKNKNSL